MPNGLAPSLTDYATPDELQRFDRLAAAPRDFKAFVGRAMPTFEWYPAQELIQQALEAVARDELRRLMVFMPPQEGKTELVSKLFPAYYLQCHPNRWVGMGAYAFTLAKTFSRAARTYFRDVVVDAGSDVDAVEQWETSRKGGLWAVGRGGSAAGKPAHLAIIDDPLKDRQEAESEVVRQTLHEWYGGVINMRLQPKNAVIIVHTRWHEDDLSGHLLEIERKSQKPERWHIIELPGVAEAPEDRPQYPPTCYVVRDWRKPGEPLGGRYGMERYEQVKAVSGSREYESQVQQRPAPSQGTIFKRTWWKRYAASSLPKAFDRTIISVDAAFKDADDSDFVAIHVYSRIQAQVYLRQRIHERMSFTLTLDTLRAVMAWYPQAVVYVEDKANGTAIVNTLQQELFGVIPVEPEGGKVARAYACQGDVEHGRVWLPEADPDDGISDFIREAASFPNAPHDDDVDAFTQAMAVFRAELRQEIEAKRVKPKEDIQGPLDLSKLNPAMQDHPPLFPKNHGRLRVHPTRLHQKRSITINTENL